MNRILQEATVRTYHYENRAQLQEHLAAFLNAYKFAKRLKTLSGLSVSTHLSLLPKRTSLIYKQSAPSLSGTDLSEQYWG